MNRPVGYEKFKSEERSEGVARLPVGCYVCMIQKAEETVTKNGFHYLTLYLDVCEGEKTGFFMSDYQSKVARGFSNVKYNGTFGIAIPADLNDPKDWRVRNFKNNIWAIEQSNPGYTWDWNEMMLARKYVGINVREREWLRQDGEELRHGVITEIGQLETVSDVRSGKCKEMKRRGLSDEDEARLEAYESRAQTTSNQPMPVEDVELPF